MARPRRKSRKSAEAAPVQVQECGLGGAPIHEEHHHHETVVASTMYVRLRPEADPASRTGVAFRAYYVSNGQPPQSLHLGGETEQEARYRVLGLYPGATIELEEKKACCASCAAGRPCEGTCGARENPIFTAEHPGMAGEPLLAVYEGDEIRVTGCGACSAENLTEAPYPSALRFEKVHRSSTGFRFEPFKDVQLPPELRSLYSAGGACRGASCLPWIRVEKDPQRFRAALQAARKLGPIKKPADFCRLMMEYLVSQDQEVFIVLLLDVHQQVLGIGDIARGARDRVLTPIPDILRLPIVDGATAFIVAHNHPSGKPTPSAADKEVTKAIKEGAEAINLLFLDHIVVGANGYYSFSAHGLC